MDPGKPVGGVHASARVVEAVRHVNSPLGFFALVLLFLYLFLIAAGTSFGLPESVRVWILVVGVVSFLVTAGAVVFLAAKHPTSLVFGEQTQLRYQEMLFGSQQHPASAALVANLTAVPAVPAPAEQPETPLASGQEGG